MILNAHLLPTSSPPKINNTPVMGPSYMHEKRHQHVNEKKTLHPAALKLTQRSPVGKVPSSAKAYRNRPPRGTENYNPTFEVPTKRAPDFRCG